MFRQQKWTFTGASGMKYNFSMMPKSEGLPQAAGVFILAYSHPRGHMAGWQANPLLIVQAKDMSLALDREVELDADQNILWNSNFVLLESDPSAREQCVHDLKMRGAKYFEVKSS